MAELKDSGNRREFESGAVRDMQEGKGRCDLLPLGECSYILNWDFSKKTLYIASPIRSILYVLNCLDKLREMDAYEDPQKYCEFKDYIYDKILNVAVLFINKYMFNPVDEDWTYIMRATTAILELAKHFEDGAKKYGDNNWRKGIPITVFLDSAIRHYLKFRRGDKDEPHDRAFLWNLVCAAWTLDNIGFIER